MKWFDSLKSGDSRRRFNFIEIFLVKIVATMWKIRYIKIVDKISDQKSRIVIRIEVLFETEYLTLSLNWIIWMFQSSHNPASIHIIYHVSIYLPFLWFTTIKS